tara:strand:- start:178 stop:894 length:717 start_codon:yes stop_codon:yes gene_type:complete
MKIITTWIKIKRKKVLHYKRNKRWKKSYYCKVRKGNSIIIQMRLENFWNQFYSNKKSNKIGLYIMSKDKIDNDRIDYCYVYLTGKVRLIIKKLWIKRIDLVKEQKQKLANRDITNYWYSFTFNKQKDLRLRTTHGIMTDICYCESKDVETKCTKLNGKQFTQLFYKVWQVKGIGLSGLKKSKRRELTTSTHKRQALNTIKYKLLKLWGLWKYVDDISKVRMTKLSKTKQVIGRNYLKK